MLAELEALAALAYVYAIYAFELASYVRHTKL